MTGVPSRFLTTEQKAARVKVRLTALTWDLRQARANGDRVLIGVLEQREDELYEELYRLIPAQRGPSDAS